MGDRDRRRPGPRAGRRSAWWEYGVVGGGCARVLAVVAALVVSAAGPAGATGGATEKGPPPSSVQVFADDIARALQERALAEGFKGGVRLVLDTARGVDVRKARSALLPRVRKALRGGPLESSEGPLRARLALSEESGALWAVVVVDGPALEAPSTVVVSARVDRELQAALGAVSKTAQGRFLLERRSALPVTPGCPILDVSLVDVDGDPAQELAVLTRCAVDVHRVDDGAVLERVTSFALPARRWPRVALGWLAPVGGERAHRLWVSTSAGHAFVVDVRSGEVVDAPGERVPLRGAVAKDGPLALRWRFGSPVLSLPLISWGGVDVVVSGLPLRLRDLALVPDGEHWVFVAEDGTLAARDAEGALSPLAPERVGDRVSIVDLDADGEPDLITTSAASPGEPDQLVVRRPAPDFSSSSVVLKSPLSGGSIVGVAVGHVDYDARVDVVVVEEALDGGSAAVWRLGHVP